MWTPQHTSWKAVPVGHKQPATNHRTANTESFSSSPILPSPTTFTVNPTQTTEDAPVPGKEAITSAGGVIWARFHQFRALF